MNTNNLIAKIRKSIQKREKIEEDIFLPEIIINLLNKSLTDTSYKRLIFSDEIMILATANDEIKDIELNYENESINEIYEQIIDIWDSVSSLNFDETLYPESSDEIKYDFVFGLIRPVVKLMNPNFSWADPDTSYKEDYEAFINQFKSDFEFRQKKEYIDTELISNLRKKIKKS